MQNSQLPLKWYKPFAADDANKVEIPVTTPDPTRASQSAGFPPLTMQPPESGGVPPQGEDFNGAMNQVARIVWWKLAGGALPFDNSWATNPNIGGYPQGANITAADLLGEWISAADNNTNNPDTLGTSWLPGYHYGAGTTAVTTADVTLTPAQAAKPIIIVTGAMTAARQLIFPAWSRDWIIVNNTTGGFALTVKTAAGAGVVLTNGAVQLVLCDGANFSTPRAPGSLVRIQTFTASSTYTRTPGARGGLVRILGAGAGGSGSVTTGATDVSVGRGGGSGAVGEHWFDDLPATQAVTVGAGGAGGTAGGGAGGAGGTTTFGALSAPGGQATATANAYTPPALESGGSAALIATGCNIFNGSGQPGTHGQAVTTSSLVSGAGGPSPMGGGGAFRSSTSGAGNPSPSRGAGGGGASNGASTTGFAGGSGGNGLVIVYEFA